MTNIIIILAILVLIHVLYVWSSNSTVSHRDLHARVIAVMDYLVCFVSVGICGYIIYNGGIIFVDSIYIHIYEVFFPIFNHHPFMTNLLSTLAALIIAFGCISPRIVIAPQIIKDKGDDYIFSFENNRFLHCSNVEISINGYSGDDENRDLNKLEMHPEHLQQMGGLLNDNNRHIKEWINIPDIDQYRSIEISIRATHPISNVTKVFTYSYAPSMDCISNESSNLNEDNFRTFNVITLWREILLISLVTTFIIYKLCCHTENSLIPMLFNAEIVAFVVNEVYRIILHQIPTIRVKLELVFIIVSVVILVLLFFLLLIFS